MAIGKINLEVVTVEASPFPSDSRTLYVTNQAGHRTVIAAALLDAITEYQTAPNDVEARSWLQVINMMLTDNRKILRPGE